MRYVLTVLLLCLPAYPGMAQHNHHLHHNVYQNWVNHDNKGCCNNQDCGELADTDERMNGAGVEVRVEGEWCPVRPHMYLKMGNAPNWSTSHVCVLNKSSINTGGPCERLICYQPKPGI
jgi:hypothetical protein